MSVPWLTVLWLVPAAASVVVMLIPPQRTRAAKITGSGAALAVLVWAVILAVRFAPQGDRFQMTEDVSWIPAFGARYSVALDGVSLVLILLTTALVPLLMLAGWRDADHVPARGPHTYFTLILAVEAMVLMSFVATDVLLFYLVFEAMLVPMYFLIGGFGPRRRSLHGLDGAPEQQDPDQQNADQRPVRSAAAVKFLLYNLFGGLIMLAAVIGLYVVSARSGLGADGRGTFDLETLSHAATTGTLDASPTTLNLLFWGFMFAFAVKAPLWPLHAWLPDAAVATTPAAAVLMMAVMDKVGTFAMLRLCVGLFPDASATFAPLISGLAVVSVVYGAVAAIAQRDVMRLIAYTSISHFGFIILGIFALTSQGQSGSTLYMVNHGISTAALFLIAGFLVSQRGSRLIADYGGIAKVAPVLAGTFLVAGLATLSLPGLAPFISEFLVLIGTFTRYPVAAVIASVALVLSALYVLWTYQRMMGGPPREPLDDDSGPIRDLGLREKMVVAPLIVALIALGFFPRLVLDFVDPAITHSLTSVGQHDPQPAVAGGPR